MKSVTTTQISTDEIDLASIYFRDRSRFKILDLNCDVATDQELNSTLVSHFMIGRQIRGLLGYGLREHACLGLCETGPRGKDKECSIQTCAYSLGFGSKTSSQGHQQSAAAFRLSPNSQTHQDQDQLSFKLTLFGESVHACIYWILGIQRGFQRGLILDNRRHIKCQLMKVTSEKAQTLWDTLEAPYPKEAQPSILWSRIQMQTQKNYADAKIRVSFLTPFESRAYKASQFELTGGPLHMLEIPALILMIKRRLEELSDCHSDRMTSKQAPSRAQFQGLCSGSTLIEHSLHLVRSKVSQKRGVLQFVGEINYQLPPDEKRAALIWVILKLGEQIGIGRGGVEGRGVIQVRMISN